MKAEIASTIISLISLVDIQQGKEYFVLGKYGANHIAILDDNMCERLLAHYEYIDAERIEMKVKYIGPEGRNHLTPGVTYIVHNPLPRYQHLFGVINDIGKITVLTEEECEIINNDFI
jgi:hypothetical protein